MSGPSGEPEGKPPKAVPSGQEEAILSALGEPLARRVLLETNATAKSAQELLRSLGVPQSTLYRKLHELREAQMISIQRTVVTPDGRRVDLFRSLLHEADVHFHEQGVRVRARFRDLAAERLADLWTDVQGGGKP